MEDFNFSIIVATYNPDYVKLFKTLNSILIQEKCSFEIIISDDGTENFNVSLINDLMKSRSFKNYKIISNKENMGTVKNFYQGLLNAQGKYIKLISPGDYLYDKNTLYNIYNFMENNNYNIIFGKAIHYCINKNKEIIIINKQNPNDIKPYILNNPKKIKKSYLIYQDYILGVAFACEKLLLLKYIEKIVDKVLYAEDCSVIIMIADDIQIHYLDKYIIWYESSTGISTSGNLKWSDRLKQDNKKCFELIVKEHPDLRYIFELHYGKNSNKHIIFKLKKKIRKSFLSLKKMFKNPNNPEISIKTIIDY